MVDRVKLSVIELNSFHIDGSFINVFDRKGISIFMAHGRHLLEDSRFFVQIVGVTYELFEMDEVQLHSSLFINSSIC